MSEFPDAYSRITNKIIADLEQGVRPWMKPWSAGHAAGRITRPLRHNGIPYKGINVIMLWSASVTKGYVCPLWLTFKQAIELGGHVKKGEEVERGERHRSRRPPDVSAQGGTAAQSTCPFRQGRYATARRLGQATPARSPGSSR